MKSKSFMTLPVELTDTLRDSELLLVLGGFGSIGGANNASGTCVGANNSDGLCTGTNNANGRCNVVNNGSGSCGTPTNTGTSCGEPVNNGSGNCMVIVNPRPDKPIVP